jgi:drug/metabolite transporter (DMT)-like permease
MSDPRLGLTQILLLAGYAAGMAGGQILFKLASQRLTPGGKLVDHLLELSGNAYFLAAVCLYGVLAIAWVWILSFTPLSRAYPFVALAFAITPLLGAWLFVEPITARLLIGIAVILVGLVLVVG